MVDAFSAWTLLGRRGGASGGWGTPGVWGRGKQNAGRQALMISAAIDEIELDGNRLYAAWEGTGLGRDYRGAALGLWDHEDPERPGDL